MIRTSISSSVVESFEVTRRGPVAGGATFGASGAYEKLIGRLRFAVDPDDPAYTRVVDLPLARRDDDGRVRFAADLVLLKPVDGRRGNGTLLVEVPNRGLKAAFRLFHRGGDVVPDPETAEDFADGFLLRRGYTLAWIGWQSDLPHHTGMVRRDEVPLAEEVEGLVRVDRVMWSPTQVMPLGHLKHLPYPAADLDDPRHRLTVRTGPLARRRTVPRDRWRFARVWYGKIVEDPVHLFHRRKPFRAGRLYELVYVSRQARVEGLGLTAVRDAVAFLRHAPESPVAPRWTLAVGASQTGRWLRHFLWQGFNVDGEGRRVFDGVMALTAGAGRGNFNHRFAQPSIDGHATVCLDYPVDLFPFADLDQTDPETGETGGLLAGYEPAARPKVFHLHTSYDYWGRAAALTHTTLDGAADLPPGPTSRAYHLAATQHSAEPFPPERRSNRHPRNPLDVQGPMRALLEALRAWVAEGREPPPSRLPRLAAGELVPLERLAFPELPMAAPPRHTYRARRLDFGRRFASEGIVDREAPRRLAPYPQLLPQVDADGNEIGGIRVPELAVPLATYTPWNYPAESDDSDWPAILWGSFFPFPRTAAERRRSRDPRRSIAERYAGRDDYLVRYARATDDLLAAGYLLAEDREALLERARVVWDVLAAIPAMRRLG